MIIAIDENTYSELNGALAASGKKTIRLESAGICKGGIIFDAIFDDAENAVFAEYRDLKFSIKKQFIEGMNKLEITTKRGKIIVSGIYCACACR